MSLANKPLSQVRSDMQDLRQQLNDELFQSENWKTLLSSSTGQMLIEFVAGIGAYAQLGIERAVQELSRDDLSDPISMFKMARTFGVRILRRRPGIVSVKLTRQSTGVGLTIPAYSKFTVNGSLPFMTVNAINFLANELEKTVELVEGDPVTFTYKVTGEDYQLYQFGNPFELSNDHLRLQIDGIEYQRDITGIWNYDASTRVFYESTLPDGRVEVLLGSGVNGYKPTTGSTVTVTGYTVRGAAINSTVLGLKVSAPNFAGVKGVTVTPISGGEDPRGMNYYRYNVPKIFAAAQRAVRRSDFAVLSTYADVIDIRAVGEADVNPGDYRWMSTVGLVVLTGSVWSDAQQAAFLKWAEENYTVFGYKLLFIPARPVLIRPLVKIVVDQRYVVTEVVNAVSLALQSYFNAIRTSGVIGKPFYPGDIAGVIQNVSGVSHSVMESPNSVVEMSYDQYAALDPTFEVTGVYA